MANQAELLANLKQDPLANVWDAIARLTVVAEQLERDVEDMKLRESVDQGARDALDALTERVATLEADEVEWDEIVDKPSTFPPSIHDNTAHDPDYLSTVAWGDITGKPSTFIPSVHANEAHDPDYLSAVDWSIITGKPSTFTPSVHANEAHDPDYLSSVAWGDVTDKPTTFPPSTHDNDEHDPDYALDSHTHSYASGTHTHNVAEVLTGVETKPTTGPIG